MKLLQQIKQDLTLSLKNGNREKALLLRTLLSEIHNAQIKVGKDKELSDEDIINVLTKEAKKRKDAFAIYTSAKEQEKAQVEKQELEIISTYLPQQLSQEEIVALVKKAIKETHATGIRDIGKVMGAVMKEARGRADGKLVKELAEQELKK